MGSEYHDDSFSGNHNSFVFIIKSLGLVNSLWGMILPMVPHAYGVFLFRQYFMEMPDSLYESARIDGCSVFQTLEKYMSRLQSPCLLH